MIAELTSNYSQILFSAGVFEGRRKHESKLSQENARRRKANSDPTLDNLVLEEAALRHLFSTQGL